MPLESDRPQSIGDGTGDVGPFYLAFTQTRLGSTNAQGESTDDAWQDFGLDLDGVCTNAATCAGSGRVSCRAATESVPFDGQLCRDNTFARLQPVVADVPEIGERFGLSEHVFNCALWRGSYNMITRVSGYNGQPNDSHVRVDFYHSTGLEDGSPWNCEDGENDFKEKYPRWRVSQKWGVNAADLTEPATAEGRWPDSKAADVNAYVKNGYLVARIPDGANQGFMGDVAPHRGFLFKAFNGYFLGRVVRAQDGTWAMQDGLETGRIRKQDLVQAFREIGFCEGGEFSDFYMSMLAYVDENADVLANGENSAELPCDAMSYAIGFEAAQVTPGKSAVVPARLECCLPGKTEEQCTALCGDGKVSGDEKCDTAIAAGQPGACPTACPLGESCAPQMVQGSACMAACTAVPITMVGAKDSCCPQGANALTDSDCSPVCGNGVIEANETCDPLSACLPCVSNNPCLPRHPLGSADSCNLRCETTPVTACMNGDRCCPSGCTRNNDPDCSAACGNGVIDSGETCEANSSTPCPADCNDKIGCTLDRMTGSATNCNAACDHVAITHLANDDGCCPTGASANNDSDCNIVCGNNVVETGEQCDDGNQVAGDGCVNCETETPTQTCLVRLGSTDACASCTCSKCTSQALACQGASNADDAKLCEDMVNCARETDCRNPDCFCGKASTLACLANAIGPCKDQVVAAARSNSALDVLSRASNTSYPLGRANELGACVDTNCKTDCSL